MFPVVAKSSDVKIDHVRAGSRERRRQTARVGGRLGDASLYARGTHAPRISYLPPGVVLSLVYYVKFINVRRKYLFTAVVKPDNSKQPPPVANFTDFL